MRGAPKRAAYEFRSGKLGIKQGWPASTASDGQAPEGRGMAAGDLDGDGQIEVVVTTTNIAENGAQVFVFSPLARAGVVGAGFANAETPLRFT